MNKPKLTLDIKWKKVCEQKLRTMKLKLHELENKEERERRKKGKEREKEKTV